MELKQYDENSIITLNPREAIRSNLGMYIGDSDIKGLHHLLTEIISNSMDEAAAGFGNTITVKIDSKLNQASVIDEGRGIPFRKNKEGKYAIVEMCTSLHSGGKFKGAGNYKSSLGLHGLGASLVQSLSTKFSIFSAREDGSCDMFIEAGDLKTLDIKDVPNKKTGSIVTFIPDTEIFGKLKWEKQMVLEEVQLHALLNNGLKFIVFWDDEKVAEYCYKNGVLDMLKIKTEGKEALTSPIYNKVVINEGAENQFDIEFAFKYVDEPGERIYAFTNGGYNEDDGTHVTGFKTAYTSLINQTARKTGDLKDSDDNFSGDTIRRGLVLILNLKMFERPMFAEQTKKKLTSPTARSAVSQAVGKIEIPKTEVEKIIKKVLIEKKAEDAAKRAKEAAAKVAHGGKNMNALKDLPIKLTDCPDRNGELFLCEGDSAAGNARITRNKKNQAILSLRGKVLNTFSKELADILHNAEIKDILTTLGCGVGENFNINNLRYDKIVIMTDADADGKHIELLLMSLFLRHLPELVKAGKIYSVMPPLYRVKNNRGTNYYFSDAEVRGKVGEITRFKGLGEMNPSELYETTLNPENRRLIQLKPENFEDLMDLYETLMGKSSEGRKNFIFSNKISRSDYDSFDDEEDGE